MGMEVDHWFVKNKERETGKKMAFLVIFVQKLSILDEHKWLMRGSSHIRSVEISVEPRNFRQTLDVYLLLFFQLIILIQSDYQRVYFLNKIHFNFFDLK